MSEPLTLAKERCFGVTRTRRRCLRPCVADRLDTLKIEISSGAFSLGPTAPPRERLPAILLAFIAFKVRNLGISHALEATRRSAATSPFMDSEPYHWAHTLLVEIIADIDDTDPNFYAHLLLGLTRTDLVRQLVLNEHYSLSALEIHIRCYTKRLFREAHSG